MATGVHGAGEKEGCGVSTPVRVTRALLALQSLLEESVPRPVEKACNNAIVELALYQKNLAAGEQAEDPFGNQS
jgi:hypothetical protein